MKEGPIVNHVIRSIKVAGSSMIDKNSELGKVSTRMDQLVKNQ